MNEDNASLLFQTLANPDRLRIIRLLVSAAPDGKIAGEIATGIGASPSRASFHLAALTDAGVLTCTRQSRSLRYTVNFQVLGGLIGFFLRDCCDNNPTMRACC